MQKRGMGIILCVSMVFIFMAPFSHARLVENYEALYKGLPGAEQVDHSKTIRDALKYIEGEQLEKNNHRVEFTGPREFFVLNSIHVAICFNAVMEKQDNASPKTTQALFALLFEKSETGQMVFLPEQTILWSGENGIEEYKKLTLKALCRLYRESGADVEFGEERAEPADNRVANVGELQPAPQPGVKVARGSVVSSRLKSRIEELESKVKKLEALLGSDDIVAIAERVKKLEKLFGNVTRRGNDVVFSGVNIKINNGTGRAEKVNGLGNLVVGYGSKGTGSHNVVVGYKNRYLSSGGLVTGTENSISGKDSVVTGGSGNSADGESCVIAGGANNTANGAYSSILGGCDNKARGKYASINGQRGRTKGGENQHLVK